VRGLVVRCLQPLVLDADGLNAFEGHYHELKQHGETASFRVLTPNSGEVARLVGISANEIPADRLEVARRISRDTGSCVVLKGWRTVVAGVSGETWLNMTGNSVLAKGGSGDVLSGMIGAALTRHRTATPSATRVSGTLAGSFFPSREAAGASELDSRVEGTEDQRLQWDFGKASAFLKDVNVAAAVYLQGLAADIVRDLLHENTVLATDLLESLAEAFREGDLQLDRGLFYLHK
jgi:NAD(P)H-hydrate repair Nnr-like enzyme with NAD(P)H-hydrate dehydratase domain